MTILSSDWSIGTMSMKSKIFVEDNNSVQGEESSTISSSSINHQTLPSEEVIPVIPRHRLGLFPTRHIRREAREVGHENLENADKISVVENDDKEFEYYAAGREDDVEANPEHEIKVKDWHVMLEDTSGYSGPSSSRDRKHKVNRR